MSAGGLPSQRVRLASAKAAPVLVHGVVDALPRATGEQRDNLLAALTVAPPGSGKGEPLDAVVALQASDHRWTATLAAAAVLVLTDAPGGEAAGVKVEPRKTAVRILREGLAGSWSELALLEAMGPVAAPLLDDVIDRMKAVPAWAAEAMNMARLVARIGPRAQRATPALLALGDMLARDPSSRRDLPQVIESLATVGAPPRDLTPFVLAHATTSLEVLRAGTRALLAVHAALAAPERALLQQSAAAFCPEKSSAMTYCTDVKDALDGLRSGTR